MIYLDHAATTPVDPRVAAAMRAVLEDPLAFANPSSMHAAGRAAAARKREAQDRGRDRHEADERGGLAAR